MKKMTFPILLFFVLIIIGFSNGCKKKKAEIHCSNAEVCVNNNGSDTIYYSWGGSNYCNILPPGGQACEFVGPINITETTEQTLIAYFETPSWSMAIKVAECKVTKNVQ